MNRIDASILRPVLPGPRPLNSGDCKIKEKLQAEKIAGTQPPAIPSLRPPVRTLVAEMRGLHAMAKGGAGKMRPLERGAATDARREEILKAGQEFEAIFFRYLVGAMRSTLPDGGTNNMGGAHFYEGLIDEHLGRVLSESGHGLRLAEIFGHQYAKDREGDEHGTS